MAGTTGGGRGGRAGPAARWPVLVARFTMCFLILGFVKALGLFLPYLAAAFAIPLAYTGFLCSSLAGLGMLTCGELSVETSVK